MAKAEGVPLLAAKAGERRGRAEPLSSFINRDYAFPILRGLSLLFANGVRVLRLLVDLNIRTMLDDEFIRLRNQNE